MASCLEVERAELESVKAGRSVYVRGGGGGGIFFLSTKQEALALNAAHQRSLQLEQLAAAQPVAAARVQRTRGDGRVRVDGAPRELAAPSTAPRP